MHSRLVLVLATLFTIPALSVGCGAKKLPGSDNRQPDAAAAGTAATGGTDTAPGQGGTTPSSGGAAPGTSGTGGSTAGGSETGGTGAGGSTAGSAPVAGSGGSGVMGDPGCEAYCGAIVEAGCDVIEGVCVASCEELLGPCDTELDAFNFCAAETGTITCAVDDVVVAGCETEEEEASSCLLCAPSDLDAPCDTCLKQSCCMQVRDYLFAPNQAVFDQCLDACETPACPQGCLAESPEAGEAYIDLVDCATAFCEVECL